MGAGLQFRCEQIRFLSQAAECVCVRQRCPQLVGVAVSKTVGYYTPLRVRIASLPVCLPACMPARVCV